MSAPDFREMTATLYRAVSAAPGERDWETVRRIYHHEALRDVRFSEVEIGQEAFVFGNVARLTSVYEFNWETRTERRTGRGVNFFTLVREEGRWRVMSIVWDTERDGNVLPKV